MKSDQGRKQRFISLNAGGDGIPYRKGVSWGMQEKIGQLKANWTRNGRV